MKITKISIANALALTTVFVWLVCSLGILFFPYPSYMMGQLFAHGRIGFTMMQWNVTFSGVFFGSLISIFFSWIVGYVFGCFLEYFSKK
jgi:hypothetical protein